MNKIWRVYLACVNPSGYGEEVVRGIAAYGRQFGPFHFLVLHPGDFRLPSGGRLDNLDGIVAYQRSNKDLGQIDWPANVPMVSVEPGETTLTPWRVVPDDFAVGRLVAEQYVQSSFRNFAYCTLPPPALAGLLSEWDNQRLDGFRSVVRAAGFEPIVHRPVVKLWKHYDGEWTGPLAQWVRSLPKPIGVMAANDMRARHLLQAAEAAGINIPEQVAVIGVDNDVLAEAVSPGISSVELDGFRAGYVAMKVLHQRMAGQDIAPEVIRIAPRRLITRRSSDIMAVDDAEVAAALRFINEHATSGIGVDKVAHAVALSRRSLEYRFRATLKRSILEEIHGVRIARAKLLLADPEIPFAKVAKTAGFRSAKALSIAFRRIVGITPSAYRAETSERGLKPKR